MLKKVALTIIHYFVVAILSLFVFKILMHMHYAKFENLSTAAYGVVEGKPHWIAFQNRLLGPYLVFFISQLRFSYSEALRIFHFAALLFQNLLLFQLLVINSYSFKESVVYVMLFSLAFLAVQDWWFYTWDSLDLIIFTVFVYAVISQKSTSFFVVLFIISLLNRETALFIALYICIDSFYMDDINSKPRFRSSSKLVVGLLALGSGLLYIKFIRYYLFQNSSDGTMDKAHQLLGNHFYLVPNLKNLFYYNFFSHHILASLFIICTISYLVVISRYFRDAQIKLFIIYCLLVFSIITFGVVNEMRLFITLLPFVMFISIRPGTFWIGRSG